MRSHLEKLFEKLSSLPSGRVSGFWFFAVAILLVGAVVHAMNKLDQAEADCLAAGGDFEWEVTVNFIDFLEIRTTCDLPDGSQDVQTIHMYPSTIPFSEAENNDPGA